MKTLPILLVGLILIVLSVTALFSLSGKAVRFDSAYDKGGDLGAFFFEKLEEGQQYSFFQSVWLGLARYRIWPAVAGVLLIALYVFFNREILYSQKVAPYVFVAPFLITFLVFFLYPLFSTVLMSFQSITGSGTTWIGWKNYTDMFSNKNFYTAVENSLIYMALTCALLIPFPLLFAYMLNSKSMKLAGAFKTISFMPVLCSVVVAGIVFRMMFSELPGALMNQALTLFGGKPIAWLKYNRWTAMFAMVLLCCWRWTGMNILYYMAGLKPIPAELYEAAEIDGANRLQKIFYINLPVLVPTMLVLFILQCGSLLNVGYEKVYALQNATNLTGSEVISTYVYKVGMVQKDFAFSTATGLFNSAVNCVILVLANTLSKSLAHSSLW